MAHQKFRMVVSCHVPLKCWCLRTDKCPDKPWQCRASAYWVMALPMADRFDQTTSLAPSFSSAVRTVHTLGMLRHGIAVPVRQLCGHAEREWNACRRTIYKSGQAPALQLLRR